MTLLFLGTAQCWDCSKNVFLFERQGYLSCYHTNPLATRKTYGIKQDEYLNSPHIMGGMDANNTMSGQSLLVLHLFITKLHI